MPLATQLGVKKETTWGTAVTVDRFFEFLDESVKLETGRTGANGLRSGRRVASANRSVPYTIGAAGPINLEVGTKGFGFWLEHILGTVGTVAASGNDVGVFTHTGTIGSLCGKGFTAQVNRPLGACGNTPQAFTWSGGKVGKATFSCEKEGNLTASLEVVFEDETTATALATAAYPDDATMSWLLGYLTTGDPATDVEVTKWSVSIDNKLKTDRLYLRGNTHRKEPVEDGLREITVDFECDWTDLSHYNRFRADTAAGATCAMTLGAGAPGVLVEDGTLASTLDVTLGAVRIDDAGTSIGGPQMLTQSVKGMALNSAEGGNDAISIAYVTTDTTP